MIEDYGGGLGTRFVVEDLGWRFRNYEPPSVVISMDRFRAPWQLPGFGGTRSAIASYNTNGGRDFVM